MREKLSTTAIRLGADDWERVHASRVARRGAHGSIVVDDPRWTRSELLRRESAIGLGFEDPATGELTHHLYAEPQGGESGPWRVGWLAYRTPRQLRELLTLLSSLADDLKLVRLIEPPGIAGEWTVTLGPESRAERGAAKDGLPRLRTSVNTFTRLWIGAARPADLAFIAPDLDAPTDLLANLDRVLRLPPPRPDWDI